MIVTGDVTTGQLVRSSNVDGLLTEDGSTGAYVDAIRGLLADPDRRRRMAREARACIETAWPAWSDILAEDLLPVWREVSLRIAERQHMTSHAPGGMSITPDIPKD